MFRPTLKFATNFSDPQNTHLQIRSEIISQKVLPLIFHSLINGGRETSTKLISSSVVSHSVTPFVGHEMKNRRLNGKTVKCEAFLSFRISTATQLFTKHNKRCLMNKLSCSNLPNEHSHNTVHPQPKSTFFQSILERCLSWMLSKVWISSFACDYVAQFKHVGKRKGGKIVLEISYFPGW